MRARPTQAQREKTKPAKEEKEQGRRKTKQRQQILLAAQVGRAGPERQEGPRRRRSKISNQPSIHPSIFHHHPQPARGNGVKTTRQSKKKPRRKTKCLPLLQRNASLSPSAHHHSARSSETQKHPSIQPDPSPPARPKLSLPTINTLQCLTSPPATRPQYHTAPPRQQTQSSSPESRYCQSSSARQYRPWCPAPSGSWPRTPTSRPPPAW